MEVDQYTDQQVNAVRSKAAYLGKNAFNLDRSSVRSVIDADGGHLQLVPHTESPTGTRWSSLLHTGRRPAESCVAEVIANVTGQRLYIRFSGMKHYFTPGEARELAALLTSEADYVEAMPAVIAARKAADAAERRVAAAERRAVAAELRAAAKAAKLAKASPDVPQ